MTKLQRGSATPAHRRRNNARAVLSTIVIVAFAALGVVALPARATTRASAGQCGTGTTPPSKGCGTGPGYCASWGNSDSAYSFDDVYACATSASPGPTRFNSLGARSLQCTELSARYLWAIHGIWAGPGTGVFSGANLVAATAHNYPSLGVGHPGPGSVPSPGDVISLGPNAGTHNPSGHTAIVTEATPSTGAVTIIGQNPGNQETLMVDLSGAHNGQVLYNQVWTPAEWLELTTSGAYSVAFQASTGNLSIFNPGGAAYSQQGMRARTSPSIAASSNGYQAAFQANTGSLDTYSPSSGAANVQPAMRAGTGPGIAALPRGGYEEAFQANTGKLIVSGSAGDINTHLGVRAGTSPSIAASPGGGFEVTFQANTGRLFMFSSSSGAANLRQEMSAGTSPTVAALPGGGYEGAFQANTGELVVFGSTGTINTHLRMGAGTSPGIAASPTGGFEVAFQGDTGSLDTYSSSSGAENLQQAMMAGTSPSIAALPGGGYEMAFQATTGDLIVVGSAGNIDTQLLMMAGTSPGIAG